MAQEKHTYTLVDGRTYTSSTRLPPMPLTAYDEVSMHIRVYNDTNFTGLDIEFDSQAINTSTSRYAEMSYVDTTTSSNRPGIEITSPGTTVHHFPIHENYFRPRIVPNADSIDLRIYLVCK